MIIFGILRLNFLDLVTIKYQSGITLAQQLEKGYHNANDCGGGIVVGADDSCTEVSTSYPLLNPAGQSLRRLNRMTTIKIR